MKQELLEILQKLSESEVGRLNKNLVREMGSIIYRLFPQTQTAKAVEEIVRVRSASMQSGFSSTPPLGGKKMKVWTGPSIAVAAKKKQLLVAVTKDLPEDEDRDGKVRNQMEDKEIEEILSELGINVDTYKDLTALDPDAFITDMGGIENVKMVAKGLQIKNFDKMSQPKMIATVQKQLNAYYTDPK